MDVSFDRRDRSRCRRITYIPYAVASYTKKIRVVAAMMMALIFKNIAASRGRPTSANMRR